MEIQICTRCILPSNFPGISFNSDGVCQYCVNDQDNLDFNSIRDSVEASVRASLGEAPSYDIVLAYSGGKDSTYTLIYLSETFPEARIVAITIDNDFLSEVAWSNCRHVPASLGVDHIIIKPSPIVMKEIFRVSVSEDIYGVASLKRASAICNSCIQVINTQILTFATNYDIPIVMGGYIGGQVPSHTGIMEQKLAITTRMRVGFIERLREIMGPKAVRLFEQKIGSRKLFKIVNPMIYLNPTEQEILSKIKMIGWNKPDDTGGSSTNCMLNDFAIHEHYKKRHYHPYIFEIATMVRKGIMNRDEALKKIDIDLGEAEFTAVREKLGLEQ